jgi:O-antigen/teichoic acid export membrane protein
MWTITGYGTGQLIRLARSLILTRLLFPEAFGVMTLVWMAIFGLEMLSDMGLAPAIMRDKRGGDPTFLNTAWTIQVLRGAVLWGISCLIGSPIAAFYGQPDLAQLIPVAGLTALIAGLNSTALHTCRRRMEFGRLTLLELSSEIVGLAVVVAWALLDPTVWALVGGALITRLYVTFASHVFLPGIRNRFQWDPSALRMLIAFGKWIFLGSVFGFLAAQGDRLLLGHYLDMTQLGVYSIAIMLSEAVYALVIRINHGVLFPAYGNVALKEPDRLRSVYYRARLGVDAFFIVPTAALMILGNQLVEVLYDARYHNAGWMLQVLCVRVIMSSALSNSEACLVALGHSHYAFAERIARAAWILIGIPLGWSVLGIKGAVWAIALCELPVLAIYWTGLIRYKIFSLPRELRSVLFVAIGTLLGSALLRI